MNNTATTTYTFTPDVGQCASDETMTVDVTPETTPSFSAIADICSGDALSLPGTSTNSISGTWSPAVNNTATTNYTFTPNAGQCATTQGLTVTVNQEVGPIFTQVLATCTGDAIVLPSTSTNNIVGSWSPAINNTSTTTYTFTPDVGQCASDETMTVDVTPETIPNFSAIADICSGDALSLPGTSTNSISGTWTPAVNNTATTNYTFTPNAGQCATTQGLTVNVNAQTTPSFSAIADICSGDALSLPGTSTNSISGTWTPAVNNTATTNYTFTPNAGQCATTQGLTVNVNAQTTPSFSAIADICSGDALSLPGTSTNSISGTWTPAVNNTATTNYTFTPNAGQCATTQGLTVNVNAQTTPSFSAIADICSGDALSLPGTSTNSISGTWTPAVNNTATTNYTFTPNAGQCATTQGLTVNVNAQTTPSFSAIADICSGDALSLPGTSTNSISGTWTPAVNNTATTNYTFTPNAGQCATTQGLTVNVNAQTTPSFSAIADICSGDALSLPGTSTNSISGTWTPAVNNTATTNYTFTPNAGQCATTQGLTVNVNAQTTPSFSAIADICSGDALSLPGTSTNSISGTWTPAVNNTATTNYTFTPNAGQCATTQGLTVNVNAQTTPSFSAIADICSGDALSLPGTSTNSISGTWTPAVNNTATTNYTFTPNAGQCATTQGLTVNVNAQTTPSFSAIADICSGDALSLPGTSTNSISGTWTPAVNNTATTNYTFTPNAGQCATTQGLTVNVNLIPQFTNSVLSDPSSCGGNDGSIVINGLSASSAYDLTYNDGTSNIGPLSITTDASGTYILGSITAGSYSSFIIADANCSFTVVPSLSLTDPSAPVFTSNSVASPSVCGGSDGEISLTGLVSNATYDLTYLDDGVSVGPITINSDASGIIALTGLNSGNYSSFVLDLSGCTGTDSGSITLTDPSAPELQITDPSAVCSPGTVDISVAAITSGSTGGGTLTYWTDASATTPLADQSAVGVSGMYYIQSESNGCTDIEAVNVVVNETPVVQITDPSAVCSPGTVDISVAAITSGSTGGGTLTYWTDASATTPLADQSAVGVSGMYYIQSESNGCTDIEAVNVVVNETPVVQITDPSAVCSPGTVDISVAAITSGSTGGGTLTYWTDASATTPLADQSAVGVSGMYYIQSESNGCTDIEAVNVVVNETPVVQITDPSAVCSPGTVDISVAAITSGSTGGGTLTYWTDASATTPLADQSAVGVSGMYYIQSESNGCTDIEAVNVVVNETPVVQITDPSAVCSPGTVDISVAAITSGSTGGGTLTYWTDASATTPLADQSAVGVSGMYYIQSESNGCTDIEAVNVVVNETPVVQITDPSAVCSPGTVDISVAAITSGSTGGGTLTYWTDASATTPLADQSAVGVSGMYYIQSESNGCTDIEAVNVVINSLPQFTNSVLSDPSSCGGNDGSIVINGLIASSAYDLTYNDGTSNIGPLSITTDASGTYILGSITAGSYSSFIIADANCSFTVVPSLSLTDPSAPVFTSNSVASPSVCGGSDGEISLTGLVSNATYDLTYLDDGVSVGPITINSDASGIIALTGLNSGNYSSFVLDLSGCTGSTPGSITLTDPPAPELQITDPSAVCSPGTVDISVAAITSGSTGGGTLTYWTDASATTPLADQSAVGVSGMYYIQSESNGCTDIEAVNVVVNETPVVQITDPSAVCSPGTVDISVAAITSGSTGGGTLTYWTDASATTPLADQSAVGVSGIYYIQSESNGCIDIEAVNVLVNETPSFTVSGTDPSVCNASDGFITIDGLDPSTDYTLSYDSLATTSQTVTITSDATGAFILNGFEAGLYDAFSITLNGCAFTAVESIDLNNPSAPSIVLQLDTVVCDTYSLGEITGDNLSGNEAYYSQSNGAGISLNAGDVITASQTVYIYDIIGACSDEASFTLTVNNTPELTNLTAQEACVSFELPTTIEGTNLSGNQNYYDAAQANGGALLTGPITTSQQVYMYDANGTCSDEVFFEVSINSLPEVVSFSGEGTYCEGETVESLTAALSGSGVLTLDYTIDGVSNSMNTSTASIDLGTAPGVYVLTQITDENCNNAVNLTQTITINTLPTAPNTSADVSYCANEQPDAMEADGSSGSYTWYADQELTDVLGSQTTYTPETILGSTSYYVTATENGCEGPAQMILIAFEECGIVIPTAFTPDGDQTNDTWSLNDIDVIYPNNVVSVYNRLGNKVYESIQGAYDQMPWDGTFNGEPLPVASYYFIIEYNDNTTPKSNGIITIVK